MRSHHASDMPSISVIIPVHNGGAAFDRCLSHLAEAVPPPAEIIVVADGDTDGSWRLAEAYGARVLRLPVAGGPAQARNIGASIAQGYILFFVDADVVIMPDAIDRVASSFRDEADLTAVFGSYDDAPAAANFLSQYKNLFHHYVHQTAHEDASTFWTACGAIRREAFFALGGFNKDYRQPTIEDIELGQRLKQSGHRIRLDKELQVKHLKQWGVRSLLKADFFYRALPWTELILRTRHVPNDLNLQRSNRLSVVLTYGFLGAFIGTWWWPGALVAASVLVVLVLTLNASLYRFFWRKRGLRFAVQAMPWHLLYYFYSGLAFACGTARYVLRPCRLQGLLARLSLRGHAKDPHQSTSWRQRKLSKRTVAEEGGDD